MSDKISFHGPACNIGQDTLGMKLNSNFPGNTSGLKTEMYGVVTIHFDLNKPKFEFVNSDGTYLTHGEVEFLTSAIESPGHMITIWYDSETCISAPLK